MQIDIDDPTPQPGYRFARQLLARKKPHTALFAYNDISAIGAIRAFQEQGLPVPQDISVTGFDDIAGSSFHWPASLPFSGFSREWGRWRRSCWRIEERTEYPSEIAIEPELVVRDSTAAAGKNIDGKNAALDCYCFGGPCVCCSAVSFSTISLSLAPSAGRWRR